MSETFDCELLLLRNQISEALGYYSPFYNSVLVPPRIAAGRSEELVTTLVHEKTHWAQFNLSPWGQFLLSLYESYVDLSEEILVHTRTSYGRIDKPLWLFMESGSRRSLDDRLNQLCNDHIDTLEALPLLFRGSDVVSTQALDDASRTVSYFIVEPTHRQEFMETAQSLRDLPSPLASTVAIPSWRMLVESWARSVEMLAAVRYGLKGSGQAGTPFRRIMHGDYGALFPIFLELSGLASPRINEIQIYSMLAACAVALQSALHAGFGTQWSLTGWADVLPEARFMKAAEAVRSTGPVGSLVPDAPRQHEEAVAALMNRICAHLGWPLAGDLAEVFTRRCEDGVVRPGRFSAGYLAAAPLIRRDPSLLAFGPCHSDWVDLESRIGGVPVFADPLLSKRIPGPAAQTDLSVQSYQQILTGVRFNLYNEILFEDSFNTFEIDAFNDAAWVEDKASRSVADHVFISPVLDMLEQRGVHVADIFQWDLFTHGSAGDPKLLLVKSAMRRTDFGAVFERDPVPWQVAINGQTRRF